MDVIRRVPFMFGPLSRFLKAILQDCNESCSFYDRARGLRNSLNPKP